MVTDWFICPKCGAGLNSNLSSCPKCEAAQTTASAESARASQISGAATKTALSSSQPREENQTETVSAVELAIEQTATTEQNATTEQETTEGEATDSETMGSLRHPPLIETETLPPLMPHAVFLAPDDETRRFPLVTRQQLVLIVVGVVFVLFLLTIGYLLWRQQQRDQRQLSAYQAAALQPSSAALPNITTETPTPRPITDSEIAEVVRAVIIAYGGQSVAKYQFEVKDGIVTLRGEAKHEPEKAGATQVIKDIAGVKAVVNNLTVKSDPSLVPVKLNEAEAKRLDEALQRGLRASLAAPTPIDAESRPKPTPSEAQREAERLQREQAAAKLREEEAASRKAAEERLRQQAAEFERQQQEQQRAEAERRARAEQARLEASALHSGTVAWSGVVDGVDEIVISGASASVRHVSGQTPHDTRASFSAPVPRAPVSVKLLSTNGRGAITIVQEPSAANGYVTIVRIDDSHKGGNKRHEFTLRWSAQ